MLSNNADWDGPRAFHILLTHSTGPVFDCTKLIMRSNFEAYHSFDAECDRDAFCFGGVIRCGLKTCGAAYGVRAIRGKETAASRRSLALIFSAPQTQSPTESEIAARMHLAVLLTRALQGKKAFFRCRRRTNL
ncbi:unnamed protein product [Pieris macdunnoughi]|uniref:Uncharacterized protein n=1 Tax=Pieris macdunnoughi TaxID=345717 RepID=A0A821XEF3_9NEOP|nr:unnamed protein product [Pieris macdunnoughi]